MKTYCLEVRGDFACFTRPEMKVERVSYDVMTPSAARAVFEAILWKPAIRWQVRRIEVLQAHPLDQPAPQRGRRAWSPPATSRPPCTPARGDLGLYIEDERQQRAGLFLRDVAYRLHAELEVAAEAPPGETPTKYREMFERRAGKGQCVNQPYLGCREFAAAFRLVTDPAAEPPPIAETRDLGFMLHDLDFSNPADPVPRFFRAQMTSGVVTVPAFDGAEVRA